MLSASQGLCFVLHAILYEILIKIFGKLKRKVRVRGFEWFFVFSSNILKATLWFDGDMVIRIYKPLCDLPDFIICVTIKGTIFYTGF